MVMTGKSGKMLARHYIRRVYSSEDLLRLIELGLVEEFGKDFYRATAIDTLRALLSHDEALLS